MFDFVVQAIDTVLRFLSLYLFNINLSFLVSPDCNISDCRCDSKTTHCADLGKKWANISELNETGNKHDLRFVS